MKGETVTVNGDPWTIVDVAPAAPLAEMVAALLEEEGYVAIVKAPGNFDPLASLGADSLGTYYVLVPQRDAEAALSLIAETVTDYEGEALEELLEEGFDAGDAPRDEDETLS